MRSLSSAKTEINRAHFELATAEKIRSTQKFFAESHKFDHEQALLNCVFNHADGNNPPSLFQVYLDAHNGLATNLNLDYFTLEVAFHTENTDLSEDREIVDEPGVIYAGVEDGKLFVIQDLALPFADEATVSPWRFIVDNSLELESLKIRKSDVFDSGYELIRWYSVSDDWSAS